MFTDFTSIKATFANPKGYPLFKTLLFLNAFFSSVDHIEIATNVVQNASVIWFLKFHLSL